MNDHPVFSDALRRAAGKQITPETLARSEQPEGDIGIGRGGAAGPSLVRDDHAERFNAELRVMSGLMRGHYDVSHVIGNGR